MKYPKDQTGIAHIGLVLVIILLAGLGFAGWRVYQNNQKIESTENTSQPEVNTENEPVIADTEIPEGFVAYKNDELGFSFAYPEDWGDVSIGPGAESNFEPSHVIAGSDYIIRFSENTAVTVAAQTKDWEHDPLKGHGGGTEAYGFTEYKKIDEETLSNNSTTHDLIINNDIQYLIAYGTDYEFKGVRVVAHKKFVNSKTNLGGLAFALNAPDDTFDPYTDKPDKIVSQKQFDEMQVILNSVKEL